MARKRKAPTPPPASVSTFALFVGLFLVGLGVFLALSFASADVRLDPTSAAKNCATGLIGAWAAFGVILTLGAVAAFYLAFLLIAWGIHLIRGGAFWRSWSRVLGGLVMLPAMALATHVLLQSESLEQTGLVAHVLGPPAMLYLGHYGLLILSLGAFFCGAVLSFGHLVFDLATLAYGQAQVALAAMARGGAALFTGFMLFVRPRVAALIVSSADRALVLRRPTRDVTAAPATPVIEEPQATAVEDEPLEVEADVVDDTEPAVEVPPEFTPYGQEPEPEEEREPIPVTVKPEKTRQRQRPKPQHIDEIHVSLDGENQDYQLPPLNLLDPPEASVGSGGNLQQRAQVLERTLSEFKIDGRVVAIERGPRVTLYEMTLAPGIRLTRVINLADNIAMALKASNVRIIAPIPGKDTIGIEIPNVEKELVTLREVLETVNREQRKQVLPLCLAKDVSGKPLIGDLTKMPHLLIAGATGSGKSVCINSIILSMMMCCKPHEVKLILVDPKVVELSRFKEVPHLMSPVLTDMKRAVAVLDWACQKMDERYEQLSLVSVNNIAKFNALGADGIAQRLEGMYSEDELHLFPKHLPYIVIIIDELADLMLVAGKEVEVLITRLAAKSRAVGIHVIFATQRPSVDVITGLIKANMPCRIAFQVASKVDSRTILDQNGAETLLGAGDMLYLPPGIGKVIRAQGVFVADEELFRIADFCKGQQEPVYHGDLEGLAGGLSRNADITDFDELFLEAGLAILESGRGSVSLLQRKLGIGYGRASRIIDQLASVAVLGPFREGKAREILMTVEEFQNKFGGAQQILPLADEGEGLAGLRDDEREPEEDGSWNDES